MKIGVPVEIKTNENRVGLTPAGVSTLKKNGHAVFLQKNAGKQSGFSDEVYLNEGAIILETIEEIYETAEMIIKVKEPIEKEYKLIREGQFVYTFFHFSSCEALTHAMIESGAVCLAYETVELPNRSLPLLTPMSEVAGRMAAQQGAKYLEKPMRGRGILLGGVPGVLPGKVVILGGGVVGTQSAKIIAGMGAEVFILDIDLERLRYLSDIMPPNVKTLNSNEYNIRTLIKDADLVIGAVLIPGAKAPKLISKEMLKEMKSGSVIVDVAVDQGGCIETCRPTTHEAPTFVIDEVLHYCVANMPGAVPCTSTIALTNATLPYAVMLANHGWSKACSENLALRKGLNIVHGKVVYQAVSEAFELPYTPVENVLN